MTLLRLREGTSPQYDYAKSRGSLLPKSLYLVDGKPRLTLGGSTEFVFVDTAMVTEIVAGLIPGGGTEVSLGNAPGSTPTMNGSPGISLLVAREDHSHPLQTSITGNAGSATTAQTADRLRVPRMIRLTGDVTGSAQFSGETDCQITTTLAGSGSSNLKFWTGTAEQLPSERESDTIYFVYE